MTAQAAQTQDDSNERNLEGLEKMFTDIVINSGVVYVTVDGHAKQVKKEVVDAFGPRKNIRLNVEKQAKDLTLKRMRQMFDLKGRHLAVKFLEMIQGKVYDERGKEIIHYVPTRTSHQLSHQ